MPSGELEGTTLKLTTGREVTDGHSHFPTPNLPPIIAATQTIGDEIFFAQNRAEDIACVRAEGFEVDDDNDPAPENVPRLFDVPPAAAVVNGGLFEGQSWGWNGIDRHQTAGI